MTKVFPPQNILDQCVSKAKWATVGEWGLERGKPAIRRQATGGVDRTWTVAQSGHSQRQFIIEPDIILIRKRNPRAPKRRV